MWTKYEIGRAITGAMCVGLAFVAALLEINGLDSGGVWLGVVILFLVAL